MIRDAAALVEFCDVDLAFGDHLVLGKLTFEIRRGEIVCVVGPSGCGKTTALRVAAGLIPPTRGEVSFAGAPVKGRDDVAKIEALPHAPAQLSAALRPPRPPYAQQHARGEGAVGKASVSMRPASQVGATPRNTNALATATAARMAATSAIVDEQPGRWQGDLADHAGAANFGFRSATSTAATPRKMAAKARSCRIAARPFDAQALAGPEEAERRKQHAHRELERILRDARQRPMDGGADRRHGRAGHQSARAREPDEAARATTTMTMNTTSIPSSSTALKAVMPAIQSSPRLPLRNSVQFAVSRWKTASSSCRATRPIEHPDRLAQPAQSKQ